MFAGTLVVPDCLQRMINSMRQADCSPFTKVAPADPFLVNLRSARVTVYACSDKVAFLWCSRVCQYFRQLQNPRNQRLLGMADHLILLPHLTEDIN